MPAVKAWGRDLPYLRRSDYFSHHQSSYRTWVNPHPPPLYQPYCQKSRAAQPLHYDQTAARYYPQPRSQKLWRFLNVRLFAAKIKYQRRILLALRFIIDQRCSCFWRIGWLITTENLAKRQPYSLHHIRARLARMASPINWRSNIHSWLPTRQSEWTRSICCKLSQSTTPGMTSRAILDYNCIEMKVSLPTSTTKTSVLVLRHHHVGTHE
jgi:hypothetical protein